MTQTSLTNILKWTAAGIALLLISLSTISYASSTPNIGSAQTLAGEQYIVTGGFSIQTGSIPLVTAITQPASPITEWLNGSSIRTALVSGHWQLPVTVRINAGAQPNTAYTVTLQGSSGASWGSFGSIGFVTPDSIHPGEEMTFIFDIGAEIESTAAFVARIA
jgi:hypothetical protein